MAANFFAGQLQKMCKRTAEKVRTKSIRAWNLLYRSDAITVKKTNCEFVITITGEAWFKEYQAFSGKTEDLPNLLTYHMMQILTGELATDEVIAMFKDATSAEDVVKMTSKVEIKSQGEDVIELRVMSPKFNVENLKDKTTWERSFKEEIGKIKNG